MENKKTDLSSLKIERSENTNSVGNKKKFIKPTISFLIIVVIIALGFLLWPVVFSNKTEVELVSAFKRTPAETNAVLTASGYIVAQGKHLLHLKQPADLYILVLLK